MKPLNIFDESSKRWLKKALSSTIRVLIILSIGAALGAFAHKKLTEQPQSPEDFQDRLTKLESARPDSVEMLSKQMEAQRGIADILVKYREAKQAKWAPYIGGAGTALTAMITGLLGWLAARFGSNTRRDDG